MFGSDLKGFTKETWPVRLTTKQVVLLPVKIPETILKNADMRHLIENITELHDNRIALLKASEKPKIGWVSIFTPEELIYAAGLIPFRITGELSSDTPNAATLLHRNICSYVLSCLEEGIKGYWDFMDGLVVTDECNSRRRLYDIWGHNLKVNFGHCIFLPKYNSTFYRDYFRDQVAQFRESLQRHYRIELSDGALRDSIELCNQTRALLEKLFSFRKKASPRFSGLDVLRIIKSSMTGLKEEFNLRLQQLLSHLESVPLDTPVSSHRTLICGSYFDHPSIIESIEKTGASVVCEDNSNGVKWLEGQVDAEADPIEAISDYYYGKFTSACMSDTDKRLDHLIEKVEEYNAESLVYFTLKFCDPNLIDYPYIKQKLKQLGIPMLFIESERHLTNTESIRTRIHAFYETKVR